jgi:hypothetical protein
LADTETWLGMCFTCCRTHGVCKGEGESEREKGKIERCMMFYYAVYVGGDDNAYIHAKVRTYGWCMKRLSAVMF